VGFRPLFFLSTPSSESIFETTFKLNWFLDLTLFESHLVWLSFAAILHCFVLHFSGLQRSSAERIVQSMTGPYYVFEDNESSLYRWYQTFGYRTYSCIEWRQPLRHDYVVDLFVIIFIALNSPVFPCLLRLRLRFPRLLNYLCLQCPQFNRLMHCQHLLSHVWQLSSSVSTCVVT